MSESEKEREGSREGSEGEREGRREGKMREREGVRERERKKDGLILHCPPIELFFVPASAP